MLSLAATKYQMRGKVKGPSPQLETRSLDWTSTKIRNQRLRLCRCFFNDANPCFLTLNGPPHRPLSPRCVVWWGSEEVRIPIARTSEIPIEIVLRCLNHLIQRMIRGMILRSCLAGNQFAIMFCFASIPPPSLSGIRVSAPQSGDQYYVHAYASISCSKTTCLTLDPV